MFNINRRNRRKITSIATAFLSLSLFLQLSCMVANSQSDSPIWMKVGTFAKYTLDPPTLLFPNGSIMKMSNTTVTFSWSCVELNSTMAKLKVSVEYDTENSTVDRNMIFYTNSLTGDVFFSNGTLIGRTSLWVQPYPTQDEQLVLLNTPQANLVGYVDGAADRPMYYDTSIQGFQKVFAVRGNGTLDDQNIPYFVLFFDFNTGILITGSLTFYEPTFVALGIKTFAGSQVYLADTNIDLGPAELSFAIREAIPYVALITAFILITIGIYYTKRKKKRKHSLK